MCWVVWVCVRWCGCASGGVGVRWVVWVCVGWCGSVPSGVGLCRVVWVRLDVCRMHLEGRRDELIELPHMSCDAAGDGWEVITHHPLPVTSHYPSTAHNLPPTSHHPSPTSLLPTSYFPLATFYLLLLVFHFPPPTIPPTTHHSTIPPSHHPTTHPSDHLCALQCENWRGAYTELEHLQQLPNEEIRSAGQAGYQMKRSRRASARRCSAWFGSS